jgi:hypothetical protein
MLESWDIETHDWKYGRMECVLLSFRSSVFPFFQYSNIPLFQYSRFLIGSFTHSQTGISTHSQMGTSANCWSMLAHPILEEEQNMRSEMMECWKIYFCPSAPGRAQWIPDPNYEFEAGDPQS